MCNENTAMVTGVQEYLRVHFPDVEFAAIDDTKTTNVLFRADGVSRYRLSITDRFMKAEDGVARSLRRLDEWELAKTLRDAKGKLVTLATTGVHTSTSRQWPTAVALRR
jgi:hypothetical protein